MRLSKSSILFLAAAMAVVPSTQGMPASPFRTFQETQPDGTLITLHLNGDPHDSWLVDEDQYTVLKDPSTGFYVYARPDGVGGLEPSPEVVGVHASLNDEKKDIVKEPYYEGDQYQMLPIHSSSNLVESAKGSGSQSSTTSFKKKKNLRPTKRDCLINICDEHEGGGMDGKRRGLRGNSAALSKNNTTSADSLLSGIRGKAGSKQRLRNLVILLQWSDHKDRILPTREDYEILMNSENPDPLLCPTGSVRDTFLKNSNGALEVDSFVTNWIPMNNTEEYYSNGHKGLTTYIQDAIRYALEYVDDNAESTGVDFDFFDEDEDGFIDSITFLHSGYAAEMGGTDAYGRFYEQRVWSHKWQLYNENFRSKKGRNIQVSAYQISSGLWGLEGSEIGRIGVVAHEMAHFLGLPDLYDTDSSSNGAGSYDLMANSWGFNGEQLHPPYMSAWTKMEMGWVTPVEPKPGMNIVEASAEQNPTHPQVYIIQEGFPQGEFLLIENRQPIGYDALLPQGGLAIWHIDFGPTGAHSMHDVYDRQRREGYPGQYGWPENGNHYGVALLQADGFYDLELKFNHGDFEDLFHADDIDEILPCKDNYNCQYPNTDSYQDGKITRSNVHITNISTAGNIMSFHYMVGESFPTDSPTNPPTNPLTSSPTASPTFSPTTEKERKGRRKGRICRNDRQCTSGFCKKRWRWFFGMGWSYFGRCALVA